MSAASESGCNEHPTALFRVSARLPRFHHHGSAVFGVPRSNQHVDVTTSPRHRRARRHGDRSAIPGARRARLHDDCAAHAAHTAARGLHHHITARERRAAPARHHHGPSTSRARLTASDLHVAAAPVRVRAVGGTARQHHQTTHTPGRQTSRDFNRASQAFLGAAAHHREVLRFRYVCGSAQIRRDLWRGVSKVRAVARAPVQNGLVHRHCDGESQTLVRLQVAQLDARRAAARYLHNTAPASRAVRAFARD